jgi:hypothetical protein
MLYSKFGRGYALGDERLGLCSLEPRPKDSPCIKFLPLMQARDLRPLNHPWLCPNRPSGYQSPFSDVIVGLVGGMS